MRAIQILFSLALLPFLSSCGSVTGQLAAGVDLSKIKHVFVERRLADNNNVRDRFVRALQERGFQAEAGPLTLMPEQGVDAVLGYEDRWDWNFRNYLVDMRVELRHPKTRVLMASAYINRGGPFMGKSTDEMVSEAVKELFRERATRTK